MESNKLNEVKNKIMRLTSCPSCGSKNVIHINCGALCASCPWDSTILSIFAGELDDLISEFDESGSHRKSCDTKDVAS